MAPAPLVFAPPQTNDLAARPHDDIDGARQRVARLDADRTLHDDRPLDDHGLHDDRLFDHRLRDRQLGDDRLPRAFGAEGVDRDRGRIADLPVALAGARRDPHLALNLARAARDPHAVVDGLPIAAARGAPLLAVLQLIVTWRFDALHASLVVTRRGDRPAANPAPVVAVVVRLLGLRRAGQRERQGTREQD
jgi:hypothetical protein